MNYRHAYHAGNFADCMKHAVLVWLLRAMARKPAGFTVLDTHAGTGAYDLQADEALRTGEADYLGVVQSLGLYPGSPAIARALLRPDDRLVCCELHPEDYGQLRRRFSRFRQVSLHLRDGYEALTALLPPAHKRGLILIDPPYEAPDEFARVTAGLQAGAARFAAGVFAAWYPVKHRAPVRAFHTALQESGLRDIVAVELLLREPLDPTRLNGCGLVVLNAPWQFEQEIRPILQALLSSLGTGEQGAAISVTRLADESGR
jgi:23S rRNA (adenine2030-N6)-methyltransferase